MEIMEIIKEAIVFPSNDLAKLAIYIVLTVVAIFVAGIGMAFMSLGFAREFLWLILGIILFIVGLAVGFIVMGYHVTVIKSGIDHAESAPEFDWKGNLITGIKYLVLNIVYFIIPTIIVLIVGWATNVFGMALNMVNRMMIASASAPANTTVIVTDVVPRSLIVSFGTALMFTCIIAFVLFVIFSIIQTMGQSRLANTDSLGDSLNIIEAFKDIGRIGYGKVIAVILLVFIIIVVINLVLSGLNNFINGISILSIIISPYLAFVAARATGLLYSDVA